MKTKPKFAQPLSTKEFIPKNKQYKNVSSQIDYQSSTRKAKEKEEMNKMLKEHQELQGCSFKPKVNSKSLRMIHSYTPIEEREYKKVVPEPVVEVEEEEPEEVPKIKKKLNKDFYEEKLKWQENKVEKMNKMRINQTLKEMEDAGRPKVNKEKNEKLAKGESDFLERMKQEQIKLEEKKKKLE